MARRVYKQVQGSRKFTYCFLQSARDEFPLHFTLAQTAKFNGNYFVRLLKSQKYLQVQITFVLFESFTKLFNFMKKAYLKKMKKNKLSTKMKKQFWNKIELKRSSLHCTLRFEPVYYAS